MKTEVITEVFQPVTVVSEMATGDVLLPIPVETLEAIREDDQDPKFATFVIEEGFSKSKRLWGKKVFQSVHEQISGAADEPIVGYLGHIRPEDDPYDFPEIQFQWLASKVGELAGKTRIFTKAYVLPGTKARYYLRRGLAKTVSWRGEAIQIPIKGGVEVRDFNLESIDLARPGKAGMSARMVGALASEMEMEENGVKPEEIAALQDHELRAHAPAVVKAIEDSATKPLNEKISEMETSATAIKPVEDFIPNLRQLLGLEDSVAPVEVLKSAFEEIRKAGKSVRDSLMEEILEKKFGKDRDTLVDRLIVGEMSDTFRASGEREKDLKTVEEMVNSVIDGDEALKAKVSEMQETPPSPPSSGNERGSEKEIKPGYKSSTLRVRSVA